MEEEKIELTWTLIQEALGASYGMGDVEESELLIKTQLGFGE